MAAGLATSVIAQEQALPSTEPAKTTQNSPQVAAFEAVTASDAAITPDSSLRIGAGDLLEFSVYNVPELSTKTRISSNGDAYLPLIDYVHIGGLTVEEAQTIIEKKSFPMGDLLKTRTSLCSLTSLHPKA